MCQQASSFFIRACFHSKKLNTENLEQIGRYLWKQGEKNLEGSEFHSPLKLKWGKSNIHRGHTMVLYFKWKCTHFSPLAATTSIYL